ncbi:homocysteine-responsive endoplasmic reticulum-resident ubiquitin-like domain member 2 protein isoform X2 [Neocloeon triangulifer]|uniref:homocysteine-responsive endoplasmic reticulum-resident ubiquitin-like domain member 2 protein isoform X2 n=1 Tax=Neocloeon triangulifer TaxID=2078957 RepID=UPI00286F96D6|nr:homocysteine-responsive endoplasmic reticulum-resident ubiquitin-like domain member 2 protein isoform X2 [Neocloeon triangulifer]
MDAIKLIVKAPNQQIEDQTIDCDSAWSVLQLKSHLSQVYPTHPAISEQKLIYYGQLLLDTLTLKDVLRDLSKGQRVHSLHLVCAPPRGSTFGTTSRRTTPPVNTDRTRTPQAETSQPSEPNSPPVPETPTPSSGTSTSSGPDLPWVDASQQQFLATSAQNPNINAYSAFLPQMYSPANMAQMQHAYSQFMAQYMFHLQQAGIPTETITNLQQGWNWNQGAQPADRPIEANNAGQQPNRNPQNNLPPQMMDDDIGGNRQRDWLDYFYISSRMLVLISIVYFYSSLHRFLLVTSLGMLLYLYHIGYFNGRGQQAQANNNPAPENNNRVPEQPIPEAGAADLPEGLRQRRRDPDAEQQEEIAPEVVAGEQQQEDNAFSVNLLWTFLTSFFSSLIPERPQAAA